MVCVRLVAANVICAAMLGGEEYPASAIGINLPNANWIRQEHGSKSVTIGNLTDAYNKAAHGNGMDKEFVIDEATRQLINRYGDALWYCYAVLSTAGFGDIVAITFIGKLVSVLVTIYTIFVVAIVTGVVVNYYGQIVEMQRRETAMMFLDKLERLPELSKEELEDISKRVKKLGNQSF